MNLQEVCLDIQTPGKKVNASFVQPICMVSHSKRYKNPHTEYINKRIRQLRKSDRWRTRIFKTSHRDFIRDFSTSLFANFTKQIFTRAYVRKHTCVDCGAVAQERCHGVGEERPVLIKRALNRVYPNQFKSVALQDILIAYLEEHKTTRFAFKCSACHKLETSILLRSMSRS